MKNHLHIYFDKTTNDYLIKQRTPYLFQYTACFPLNKSLVVD